jgi:hypothetical protein
MKKILLAYLLLASTSFASSNSPTVNDQISRIQVLVATQYLELTHAQTELKNSNLSLQQSSQTISEQENKIVKLQEDIDTLGKNFQKAVDYGDSEHKKAEEFREKYETLSVKVHEVAVAVGILFSLVAYLLVARFLGTASVLAGPYGLYIYIATSAGAFAAGLGLVELFFRHHK